MIKKIQIHGLKSIKDMSIDCRNLNLLTGTNSSGKSTVIQAILLSKQEEAYKEGLNGRLISLGNFGEIQNIELKDEPICIELTDFENKKQTTMFYASESQRANSIKENGFISLDNLHYLSCHRIGVSDIYEKQKGNSTDCGIEGEHALGVLLKNDECNLPDKLFKNDGKHINTLSDQVNYWLERIVGTTVTFKDIDRTNYLQVFYCNNPKLTGLQRFHNRPINIGSGISYIISIIITCLTAEEDSIICIENPEIHLHPKAQSELAKFLYFVASSGRQLFIETHSDHIFNGLRVGIAKHEMDRENVAIDFLALNRETFETQCNPVQINDYGDLLGLNSKMTLDDLFDQFSIDLDSMLGL